MLRRSLTAVASMILAVGLTTAVPSAPASAYDNSIGVVRVPDQIRKGGCADYLVRWGFRPPTPDWTVTATIRDPRKRAVQSLFWDSNSPNNLGRTSGSLRFEMCGASLPVGRYSVSMQMIYTDRRDVFTLNRQPVYFRLVQRR